MLINIKNIKIPELEIYSALRENKFRADNSFVADSPKVVNLVLESDLEVKSILATKEYYENNIELLKQKNIPLKYITTKDEMQKIVGHKIHHNCMLHGIRPKNITLQNIGNQAVLLDNITSSENVGSIVRSCVALGVGSLLIAKETPHPFNRRALRVSMGHSALIDTYVYEDLKTSILELKKLGYTIYAGEVTKTSTPLSKVKVAEKWVLILGHEGKGIAKEILDVCDEVVTIEMQEGIKSFNVSVAGAIILYQFTTSL